MWEWIQQALYKACKNVNINKRMQVTADEDDIVQNVMLYLCQNTKVAEEVYYQKKVRFLSQLVKREAYEQERIHHSLQNKEQLHRLQTVLNCCERFNIVPNVENSYKISALLNSSDKHYTIKGVRCILGDYANTLTKNELFRKGTL
mgnify:CR=1 FL=1